jgi:hypothetical protein
MSDPSQSQISQPRDEKPKIVFQVVFQGRSEFRRPKICLLALTLIVFYKASSFSRSGRPLSEDRWMKLQ